MFYQKNDAEEVAPPPQQQRRGRGRRPAAARAGHRHGGAQPAAARAAAADGGRGGHLQRRRARRRQPGGPPAERPRRKARHLHGPLLRRQRARNGQLPLLVRLRDARHGGRQRRLGGVDDVDVLKVARVRGQLLGGHAAERAGRPLPPRRAHSVCVPHDGPDRGGAHRTVASRV